LSAPVTVLAPTWLEHLAARAVIREVAVRRIGIGAPSWRPPSGRYAAVVCGVAGALTEDLEPGTVVVADQVVSESGETHACDSELMAAMQAGAVGTGAEVRVIPIATMSHLAGAVERDAWTRPGSWAVDMESAIVAAQVERIAVVRVILDPPAHPISAQWLHAHRALASPRLWTEMLWLAGRAPGYALRAAVAVERGLRELGE
jgi:4-hydroxy-3-methylbut-2-enyl diphosphate reductase